MTRVLLQLYLVLQQEILLDRHILALVVEHRLLSVVLEHAVDLEALVEGMVVAGVDREA